MSVTRESAGPLRRPPKATSSHKPLIRLIRQERCCQCDAHMSHFSCKLRRIFRGYAADRRWFPLRDRQPGQLSAPIAEFLGPLQLSTIAQATR